MTNTLNDLSQWAAKLGQVIRVKMKDGISPVATEIERLRVLRVIDCDGTS